MVLHIILDDKFGEIIINRFQNYSNPINKFVVVNSEKSIQNIPAKFAQKATHVHEDNILDFVGSQINNITGIIFHGLNENYKWEIIKRYKGKVHLHWKFWGTDGYMLPQMRKGLFEKETKKLYLELKNISKFRFYLTNSGGFIYNLYAWQYKIRNKEDHYLKKLEKAIKSVDSISSVVIDDYYKIKRALNLKAPHLYLYYTADGVKNLGIEDNSPTSQNIIIGNSAAIVNNHIDAFNKIKNYGISSRKIIVPLNYGGGNYPGLIERITQRGIEVFKSDNFMPLTQFIEKKEYSKLLSTCSHAIMNHNKQHAGGNINMLLYIGTKIFLNDKNPIYTFLKRNNIIIFNTKELSQEQLDTPLSKQEIQHNRTQLMKIYDPQLIEERHKILMDTLSQQTPASK